MSINRRNWEVIGKYVSRMKEMGLSYVEGADHFGISIDDVYEYNRWLKKSKRADTRLKRRQEELADYVSKIKELGMSLAEGAKHFGISANTLYGYNRRIKKKKRDEQSSNRLSTSGIKAKLSGSSSRDDLPCPGNGKNKLPLDVEELIVNYRREHPDHGYKRIEDYLKSRYFVLVSRKKIREVLKSHGLSSKLDSSFDNPTGGGPPKGSRRFEASYPRELYQMDITYVYIADNSVFYLVIIVDDYSRFCVSCELRRDQRGTTMVEVLHRAIERWGKPCKLLSDQGSSFYSWSHEHTIFQRYLDDMKIEHIVADPHSPQTLGKVERLNQTVQRELIHKRKFGSYEEARREIEEYFHHYNYERVHQGIGGAVPGSRFHGIIGETARIESEISSPMLDFSKGYLVFKTAEHTISIVCSANGLQIYLDGHLMSGVQDDSSGRCQENRHG